MNLHVASLSGQNHINGEELEMQAVPESICRLLDWILSSRGSMSKMEPGSVRQTLRSFTKGKKSTNQEWIKKKKKSQHQKSQVKVWKRMVVKSKHMISKPTLLQMSEENKGNSRSPGFTKPLWSNLSCPVYSSLTFRVQPVTHHPAHVHTRQVCAAPNPNLSCFPHTETGRMSDENSWLRTYE